METDRIYREIRDGMQYIMAKDVINELNIRGIDYVIVKGCPLAYYKTRQIGTRISNDIDILTYRQNVVKIEEILARYDFKCVHQSERSERIMLISNSHQVPPYSKKMGKLCSQIDINFDLFWGEYTGKRIDVAEFISDTVEMEIYGCQIKTLPPLKTMIQIILHHYKEMNSLYHLMGHLAIKKRFFEDVYLLAQRFPKEISVEKLYEECSKYEILPFAFYILYYTKKIYDDKILNAYLDAMRTEEGEDLLEYYGLAEQERRRWKIPFEERLEQDVSDLIYSEMTGRDKEKLKRSRRLFS